MSLTFDPSELTTEQQVAAWSAMFGTGWVHTSRLYEHMIYDAMLADSLRSRACLDYDPALHCYRIKAGQQE